MTSYFSTIVMLNIKAAVGPAAAGERFAAKQREKEIKLQMLCKLSIQEAWAGKPGIFFFNNFELIKQKHIEPERLQ